MKQRLKIISLSILVFLVTGLIPVKQAQAVIPVIDSFNSIINKIFHALSLAGQNISNLSLGLPGTGSATRAALNTGERACTTYDNALKIADTADTVSSAVVIAGSAAELVRLNTKIAALTGLRTCYSLMRDALKTGGTVAGVSGNQALEQITGKEVTLTQEITSLSERLDKLKELKNQALKELWKGVAVRTLMRVQMRITTNLVNQLVAKYKISNILNYADAAATQIYMIDYINKNVPEGKDRAILRSIFANQGLHDTVYPMIRTRIEQQLQKAPGDLFITSASFYDELNQFGSAEYNPHYMTTVYENTLDVARAQAATMALQEVQTGQGFLPVRNCTDIMVAQRQYDQDNIRLSYEVRQAEDALSALQTRQATAGRNPDLQVDPNEIKIAQARLNEAQDALDNFSDTEKAFTPPCGPIVNPGYSIAQSINSYLSSQLDAAANLKTENLPFFATFAESVASNFLTRVITSGLRPNNNLLTDNGYQPSSISPSAVTENSTEADYLKTADLQAERHSSSFSGERTANPAINEYVLRWNVQPMAGASYVIIRGPNSFNRRFNLVEGSVTVSSSAGGLYVLTVYNAQNQTLDSATFEMPSNLQPGQVDLSEVKDNATDSSNAADSIIDDINTGPPLETIEQQNPGLVDPTATPFTLNNNISKGLVAGASIKKPSESPRGHNIEKLR